jgi:hypothetical protein
MMLPTITASEVKPGDWLDLEGDEFACAPCEGDPDCTLNIIWQYEYGIVYETWIEDGGLGQVFVIHFENDQVVGFPMDHPLRLVPEDER